MKKILFAILLLGVAVSCRKRLDSFLFNPSQLESYQLDAYQGELTLDLGGQFDVPDSLIHQFQMEVGLEEGNAQMPFTLVTCKQLQPTPSFFIATATKTTWIFIGHVKNSMPMPAG
jgi:hypothetical protein